MQYNGYYFTVNFVKLERAVRTLAQKSMHQAQENGKRGNKLLF